MRGPFDGDCKRFGCIIGLPGGVTKRVSLDTLRGLVSEGELVL